MAGGSLSFARGSVIWRGNYNRIKLGMDDVERAGIALKGVAGKRLTHRMPRH
jgi:hypothetical protein